MDKPVILVADDEERIRELVRMYLKREGFRVLEAASGEAALAQMAKTDIALLILDIMLPDMDGWSVCRRVREEYTIPIIMLTARGDEYDRILGFELGADDYVVKPFSPRELVARVKAVLKRTSVNKGASSPLRFPGLVVDSDAREVRVNDQPVVLTPKEYELLLYLAGNAGKVCTREQILNQVWGFDFYGDYRTVDTHIKQLREKLTKKSGGPNYIQTVWGVGYKFEVEPPC